MIGDEGALEEMKKFLMYCFKREFPDLYEHESQGKLFLFIYSNYKVYRIF
jgi:hypothetical protein